MPPMANLANCVDQMERIMTLDSVVHVSVYGFDALDNSVATNALRSVTEHSSIDWNLVLRKLNREYDEAAAAMRVPSGAF